MCSALRIDGPLRRATKCFHPQKRSDWLGTYLATVLHLGCRVSFEYFVNYRYLELDLCVGRFENALSVR